MNKESFKKGWMQVQKKDILTVKTKLMQTLSITSRTAFYNRLNGLVLHSEADRICIEAIFKEHGITEVWGK